MPPRPRQLTLGRVTLPLVVAALIVATALASIAGAVGTRNGLPELLRATLLIVPDVWHGQLWRLVTWVLFELEPLSLVFGCLTLYWFGAPLASRWGSARFLGFYGGVAAAAAVVTTLVALPWPEVALHAHAGGWPVLDALVIAWGLLHARARVRFFGVLPLEGRHLIALTIGGTALYALFYGVAPFVPHFAAELLVLGGMTLAGRAHAARVARAKA
jgi:membrane associated rhomboid family serine protease